MRRSQATAQQPSASRTSSKRGWAPGMQMQLQHTGTRMRHVQVHVHVRQSTQLSDT